MTATLVLPAPAARGNLRRRVSDRLYAAPGLLLLLLLAPPMLWLGVVYLGSLFALLANSFFQIDDYSGRVVRELTLANFIALAEPANLDVALRTATMAVRVTLACIGLRFPVAYYMALHTRGAKRALFYVAVMLPLWSSYLVRLYAWKLLLAKEGAVSWLLAQLHLSWLLDALLEMPLVGGNSLSFSPLGTFIVFTYMWLPFMILPVQAAIERIPPSMLEASADLGATPARTFRNVILPLAWCGGRLDLHFLAHSGRLHHPQVIGQVVSIQQGMAGNIPFAAAFSLLPIVLVAAYLRSPSGRESSMRSEARPASIGLSIAAWGGLAFLHIPLAVIVLCAFS